MTATAFGAPLIVPAIRHNCPSCSVEWNGANECWMCGKPGEKGYSTTPEGLPSPGAAAPGNFYADDVPDAETFRL